MMGGLVDQGSSRWCRKRADVGGQKPVFVRYGRRENRKERNECWDRVVW
jgi:hypothetical protein